MIIVLYLSKLILISGLLYGYYWFFLRNKQFHQYNRFCLLSISIIAILLPLLSIPIPGLIISENNTAAVNILRVGEGNWEEPVIITARHSLFKKFFSWQFMSYLAYSTGVFFLLISLIKSLVYITRMSRRYPYEQIDDIKFFQTNEPGTPFSFFKQVFWNRQINLQSHEGQQIFRHELYHVRQKHSFDILLIEIITIIFWFNPFFYLIKKEIKAIHEFLADQYAASASNRYSYAELLVLQSINNKKIQLFNPFFHNQIKRRIAMITKFETTRKNYLSRVMILPLLFILFCAFATKVNHKKLAAFANKPITVVIDAGHGGIDNGAMTATGISEKDLTLSIAKKIKQIANAYNVNIIMTREDDQLPGKTSNIKDGLAYRVNMAAANKADLFVSIHLNADTANASLTGFEFYVPDNNSAFYQKSVQLGSVLTASIKKDYAVAAELKQRTSQRVRIFSSATVPTVLIECGYLTNSKDLAFISDDQNQEKIAKDILEGIVRFQDAYGYNQADQNKKPESYQEEDPVVASLNHHLIEHLKFPESGLEKNMGACVYAKLILNEDGGFKQITFLQSLPKDVNPVSIKAMTVRVPDSTPAATAEPGKAEITPFENEVKDAVSDYKSSVTSNDKIVYLKITFTIENTNNAAFEKNIMLDQKVDTVPNVGKRSSQKIFTKVEIEPDFPGGPKAWREYLSKTLKYPSAAVNNEIQGEVVVQFIVDKKGNISDVEAISGPEELKQESVRVIHDSGKWKPAINNGKRVTCYKKQPIIYKLETQN